MMIDGWTADNLISREELKEAIETWDKFACLPNGKLEPFRNLEHPEMFEPYVHLRDIRNAIDNAPTVDINQPAIWWNGYNTGKVIGEHERPTGKPCIVTSDDMSNYYICPCCRKPIDGWDRYCKHCGAEMENG